MKIIAFFFSDLYRPLHVLDSCQYLLFRASIFTVADEQCVNS